MASFREDHELYYKVADWRKYGYVKIPMAETYQSVS